MGLVRTGMMLLVVGVIAAACATKPAPEPNAARRAEIAVLVDRAQVQHQNEKFPAALETLARAEELGAELPDDDASRNARAQVALMAATVELGRGDDAAVVRHFARVLVLLPLYTPEPGIFSPRALELLARARAEVASRP